MFAHTWNSFDSIKYASCLCSYIRSGLTPHSASWHYSPVLAIQQAATLLKFLNTQTKLAWCLTMAAYYTSLDLQTFWMEMFKYLIASFIVRGPPRSQLRCWRWWARFPLHRLFPTSSCDRAYCRCRLRCERKGAFARGEVEMIKRGGEGEMKESRRR